MINLKFERLKAGLSQRQLAEKTKVGQNYISFAESNGFVPGKGTQKKLAAYLNWNGEPEELFREKEN